MSDLTDIPSKLWQWWRAHRALVRSRRALLNLSDDQLRDIGLSKSDALREARRPVWNSRPPSPTGVVRHDDCT